MTFTVSPKEITVTGIATGNKVYNGSNSASITGVAAYSGLLTGASFSVSGNPTAVFASKDVGAGKSVTVSGYSAPNANYSILQPVGLTANITAKSLTIGTSTIASRSYNGTTTSRAVTVGTLSGFVGSETVTATATGSSYSSANVGSYPTTVTFALADGNNGGLASNYSLANGTATGSVTAKALAITANTVSKLVGTNLTFGAGSVAFSANGLVTGESIGSVPYRANVSSSRAE
jgi:hypothetical protein